MPSGTLEHHHCQAEREQLNPSMEQKLPEEPNETQEPVPQHLPGTLTMLDR